MSAFVSSPESLGEGMPPAMALSDGFSRNAASLSPGNRVPTPVSAGARGPPVPPSPWQALQAFASKTVLPCATGSLVPASADSQAYSDNRPARDFVRVPTSGGM